MARPRGTLAATSSPQGVEMYGGRSTTDPYASYPPARSGDWSNPYPQGLPAQASPAMDARFADDMLDLAGYERREYDTYQPPPPPPPTAPTGVRSQEPLSQESLSQEAQDEHHGRLVMMELAGAAPGPASAPDPGQVRILGGPPPRAQFSEGWAAPSGYASTGGGPRSNGRVALVAACIAATIGVAAAVVISTVNAPGAARVEFGTSDPIDLQASEDTVGVEPVDPAQAVASAPAATTAPIAQRSVALAPVRRPGSTSVKPRVVGPTKTTPKASASPTKASPTPTSASPTPSAEPTPTPTTPSPAPSTSQPTVEPTPTASQPAPQPTVPTETLPPADPVVPGG